MNTFGAIKDTLNLALINDMPLKSDVDGLGYLHLLDMHARVEKANRDGTPFSEGKINRWLGWMQCAVLVACPGVSLTDMKEINKANI